MRTTPAIVVLFLSSNALAVVYDVTDENGLADAVAAASASDEIVLAAGDYHAWERHLVRPTAHLERPSPCAPRITWERASISTDWKVSACRASIGILTMTSTSRVCAPPTTTANTRFTTAAPPIVQVPKF